MPFSKFILKLCVVVNGFFTGCEDDVILLPDLMVVIVLLREEVAIGSNFVSEVLERSFVFIAEFYILVKLVIIFHWTDYQL